MKLLCILVAGLVAIGCGAGSGRHVETTPVRVLSSNGVKGIIDDVRPEIERAIGRPLAIEFSTSVG